MPLEHNYWKPIMYSVYNNWKPIMYSKDKKFHIQAYIAQYDMRA